MFVRPMLLQRIDKPFPDCETNYITELKYDGMRLILSTMSDFRLFTRHNNNVSKLFPEIIKQGKFIPKGSILDGELIATNKDGKPDFEELMTRFMTKDSRKIERFSVTQPLTYCAFDVVYYAGKSVAHLPLLERKQLLQKILPVDFSSIIRVAYLEGMSASFFEIVKKQELEGCVIKDVSSKYEIGKRSWSWQKVINYQHEEVFIAGYRKSDFGWLLTFADGRPAGIMELGVPLVAQKAIYGLTKELKTGESKDYVYFAHKLKCKVKYRCHSKSGLLRLPSFDGFVA